MQLYINVSVGEFDSNQIRSFLLPQNRAEKLMKHTKNRENRLSGFSFLFFVLFVGFYAWRVAEFGLEVKKLWEMHEFYTELLEVPEVSHILSFFSSLVRKPTLFFIRMIFKRFHGIQLSRD